MHRLDPKTTALLVVDVQERLAPAMAPDSFQRLVRGVDVLLSAAATLGVPTMVTEQYPKGLGPTIEPLRAGLERLGAKPVEKTAFSAMDVPDVSRWIARRTPRAVVVVGVEAHVCVFQTVRDLCALGLEVHLPHDGVASRRDDDKRAALELAARAGALVTSVETLVFDWLRKAEGDAFKELSKKIR